MKKCCIFTCVAAMALISGAAVAEGQNTQGMPISLGDGSVTMTKPLKLTFAKEQFVAKRYYNVTCMISDPKYRVRQNPIALTTQMGQARYNKIGYSGNEHFTLNNQEIEPITSIFQIPLPKETGTSIFNIKLFYFAAEDLDNAALEFSLPAQPGVGADEMVSVSCQAFSAFE